MAGPTATAQQACELLEDTALAEEDLLDEDDVPTHIMEARFNELRRKAEAFKLFQEKGHGVYTTLDEEKKFLDLTIAEKTCVVHFFHEDFRRCSIVDTHLKKLAETHFETKFARINVAIAPFFVEKFKIRELPAIYCFVNNGDRKDKIVGFEELGNTDSFTTETLEKRLGRSGVITVEETDEDEERKRKTIYGFKKNKVNDDSSDEDGY